MKNINKGTLVLSIWLFALLLIPSLLAAFGEDEMGPSSSLFGRFFAKLFYVLRFPTHTLCWSMITKYSVLYFPGLALNCIFYGFITERVIAFYRVRKRKIKQ